MDKNKQCPLGHKPVDILTSQQQIYCFTCEKFYPFKLKKNKKSVLIKGLVGGREK